MDLQKFKVLLVDDEPDILEMLSYNLCKHGFTVVTAPDGKAGFESAAAHQPDIIVTDILMPGWTGVKMCTELKENAGLRGIPVIFLSATPDEMVALYALESGGERFLSKPIRIDLLIRNVVDVLQKRLSKHID